MITCIDINNNIKVQAIYFDGKAQSLKDIQIFMINNTNFSIDILYTKIGYYLVQYPDKTLIWKKSKCFANNYKIINK